MLRSVDIRKKAENLKAGDRVSLFGYVYTARDEAHRLLTCLIEKDRPLPFELKDSVIYYAGPTETPANLPIGSCGPTTSGRMDKFTPKLLDFGLAATIGKGERSSSVIEAIVRNKAVYFAAVGGAGALAAQCVKSVEVIAFPELGCESIKRLYFENFPLIVAIDSEGNDLYKAGRLKYSE
ncbi:MAG: FumA C-terminus/TtdB family hydratase beta subunit [Eubacterium sp.]|jgi:fumarate hydratase subunit beta|nr:FumA C-terminus/TtdB family hydratase beta subunit [Eubacterium sp.]